MMVRGVGAGAAWRPRAHFLNVPQPYRSSVDNFSKIQKYEWFRTFYRSNRRPPRGLFTGLALTATRGDRLRETFSAADVADSKIPLILDSAHQQEHEQHDDDETKPATTIVTGPIEGTAANTTEATEQRDDQDDENNCADAHLNLPKI